MLCLPRVLSVVQAEAPPGMLLSKFKQLLESGGMSAADVAFYFVHWLTDLAGAEGAPLAGAEKFVVKFPHVVLNSYEPAAIALPVVAPHLCFRHSAASAVLVGSSAPSRSCSSSPRSQRRS
eukprot:scaffold65282_cov66-Phaeocystis_antarctica.AAC.2